MASLVNHLSNEEKKTLFSDIYYLNLKEVKSFCDKHSIPYKILIETEDGKLKNSRDKDRMKIVLERVIHYLKTGKIKPATVFRKEVIQFKGLPDDFDENYRLYYGCYDKKNPKMMKLLRNLTDGEYKNGAIARILMREFWANGEAPTFKKFARAWVNARDEYSIKQHPEAAYLNDLSKGTLGKNWKERRKHNSENVLKTLAKLV